MTASTSRCPLAGVLLLAITLLVLVPLVAFGNGGPVYSYDGNQIVPLGSDEIQLVREVVKVDLSYQLTGRAVCRYLLRNLTKQEANLSIAFIWSREVTPESAREFRAWVGEAPTPVRWMPADQRRWWDYTGNADVDSLPVWDIRIAGNDSVAVRCEYPVQFAHAYLEALRLEISARHGAPLGDGTIAMFFETTGWYSADPAYDPARLNATERANEDALLSLQQRIAGNPGVLLPLPASK